MMVVIQHKVIRTKLDLSSLQFKVIFFTLITR